MPTLGKVFVIDDDPMSRELVAMLLEAEGFTVGSAESGEEALRQLAAAPVDVVLTDMQMPGLSGAELAAALRKTCGAKTLLVAMSATKPDKKILDGFDGFILKPFDGAAFAAAVKKIAAGVETAPSEVDASSQTPVLNRGICEPLNRTIYDKMAASMKPEQLRELYAMCLEDSRRRIEKMRNMNPKKDEARFRAEAHAIKGACSMIGAARLAEIAAGLEFGNTGKGGAGKSGWGGHDSVDAALNEFLSQCDALEGILIAGK